jgi:hypothetical protein
MRFPAELEATSERHKETLPDPDLIHPETPMFRTRFWAVAALSCAACLSSSGPSRAQAPKADTDASVVVKDRGPGDVENGSAYDAGSFDLGANKKLAVPANATVVQRGDGAKVQVFLKKTLQFGGHPPTPMSIRTARANMGCATKTAEGVALVATFGEFSTKEGGADVHVTLIVPTGVTVEKRANLAGDDSAAHPRPDEKAARKPVGHWYGPAAPGAGWTPVATTPDAQRRADKTLGN